MKKSWPILLAALLLVSLIGCAARTPNAPVAPPESAADLHTNAFDFEKRTVLLNSGYEMPIIGIGTFRLSDTEAEESVYWALERGMRLIDTAAAYNNEAGVGRGIARAIADGIVTREEIFVTTKLWPSNYNTAGIDRALQTLGLDYIDLLLLHQPAGDYMGGYRAMEQAGSPPFYGETNKETCSEHPRSAFRKK